MSGRLSPAPHHCLGVSHGLTGTIIAWRVFQSGKCSTMNFMQSNSAHDTPALARPPILASNPDKFAKRTALLGIAIVALLSTVAWMIFLAWVVWSVILTASAMVGSESKSSLGCFQSVPSSSESSISSSRANGAEDVPGKTLCS
jgi:hypothetical protein